MNAGPRVLAILVPFLISQAPLHAQHASYIFGKVIDPSEAVVPGAAVTVVNQDSGFRRATETGPDGSYLVSMLDEGLYLTINSDDPPMFGTTLSEEFARCAKAFDFNEDIIYSLALNAAKASLLPAQKKQELLVRMREGFNALE